MNVDLSIIRVIFTIINLTLILFLGILNFKDLGKYLYNIGKKYLLLLFFIFLLGLVLRISIPAHHGVYDGEWIYMNIGKNILYYNWKYSSENVNLLFRMPGRNLGHIYLISLSFMFLGLNDYNAILVNIILGSLSIVLVFLLTYSLVKKGSISLFSALFFALLPLHIRFSATAVGNISHVFFMLISLFLVIISFKINTWRIKFLAFACLAYTIQISPENVILLFLTVITFPLFSENFRKKLKSLKFYLPWVFLIILVLPHLVYLNEIEDVYHSQLQGEELFSFKFAERSFPILIYHILSTAHYSPVFIILIFLGFFIMTKEDKKLSIFLRIWFLIFFLTYLLRGGLMDPRIDCSLFKRILSLYPPILIFGAYGLKSILEILNKKVISLILIFFVIISCFLYMPIAYYGNICWKWQRSEEIFTSLIKERVKNENCYIITGNTMMVFWVTGKKTIPISCALELDIYKNFAEKLCDDINVTSLLKGDNCVLFYENTYCETYSANYQWKNISINECREMHKKYDLKLILEKQLFSGNFYLHNVSLRK